MYTHAYSDYVNHILNKSPSKSAYSFTRAARFPEPPRDAVPVQQPFLAANGFDYSDGARYVPHTPSFYQALNDPNRKKTEKVDNRSRSKSPLRVQRNNNDHQTSRGRDKKQESYQKPSTAQTSIHQRSVSKSPTRNKQRKRGSPSKTFTQELEAIDHVCKNATVNGYYPTGYQLSPVGKYSISGVKNTPAHSFGKSSSKERYQYLMKSDDELGPGYYQHFSEFGQTKR